MIESTEMIRLVHSFHIYNQLVLGNQWQTMRKCWISQGSPAQAHHCGELGGREVVLADALRWKQLHHCFLQYYWSGFCKHQFTQKMKNINLDGRKVRLQIVWLPWFSGILQDKRDTGPSQAATIRMPTLWCSSTMSLTTRLSKHSDSGSKRQKSISIMS